MRTNIDEKIKTLKKEIELKGKKIYSNKISNPTYKRSFIK